MHIEIRHNLDLLLGGAAHRHDQNQPYGAEIINLLNTVWPVIRAKDVKHNGINIVVYEADDTVFAGVEMSASDARSCGLAVRHLRLADYAYCKHVGPYDQLTAVHAELMAKVKESGHVPTFPRIEVYGHWTEDPSELVTEVLFNLGPAELILA